MKYTITIFNTLNGTTQNLTRDNWDDVKALVDKELGGFDNTRSAMTGGSNLHSEAYIQGGSTKDGSKMFSILAF